MVNKRIGLLVATLAIVASACSSGGATTAPQSAAPAVSEAPASEAPAASAPASAAAGSVHGRRVVEQLPAATLGRARRAEHQGHRRGRRWHATSSKDANLSTEQQLTDVDTLLSQGANVLIILAQDPTVIGPAVEKAKARRRPGHRL